MKGGEYYISKPRWSSGKMYAPDGPSSGLKEAFVSGNSKFTFFGEEYEAAKLRRAGGAERPVLRCNEPKKTGARSSRARMRGQNPLVVPYSVLPVTYPERHVFQSSTPYR